jgi:hypothetical protein
VQGLDQASVGMLSGNGSSFMSAFEDNAIGMHLLEAALLLVGLGMYLKSTNGTSFAGKYGMIILIAFMLVINANNIFRPPLSNDTMIMLIVGLLMYFIFSGVAFWLDRKRC